MTPAIRVFCKRVRPLPVVCPEVAAIAMSASPLLVAANALLLKHATIRGLK